MSPTARALWIVFAWTVLGLGATIVPALIPSWWIAGGVIAILSLLDLILLYRTTPLTVDRKLPHRFAVGKEGEVHLQLTNPGPSAVKLEVFDGIPQEAEAPSMPWSGKIPSGGKAKVSHLVRIMERGVARFGQIHIRRYSPIGLWTWRQELGEEMEAKVYPDYEPVLRFALLAMEQRQDQMGIVRKAFAGSSRDFHQLREYREGDSLTQIDWKATSRRLSLISREYQEQRNQTIIFLTDTGRRMRAMDGDFPQFDHCLNAMLLLSYIALKQGDQIGVQAFGGTNRFLPPIKGTHSMSVLLNHLFDYQTSSAPSDFAEAAELLLARQRRRAMVVVMTNLRGEDQSEILPALRTLRQKHLVLLASLRERSVEDARTKPLSTFAGALRFAAAEAYHAERAEVLASLRGHGILCLDSPAQDLPVALANRYLDIKASGRL